MRRVYALPGLVRRYGSTRLTEVCTVALAADMLDVQRLRRMLEHGLATAGAPGADAAPRALSRPAHQYAGDDRLCRPGVDPVFVALVACVWRANVLELLKIDGTSVAASRARSRLAACSGTSRKWHSRPCSSSAACSMFAAILDWFGWTKGSTVPAWWRFLSRCHRSCSAAGPSARRWRGQLWSASVPAQASLVRSKDRRRRPPATVRLRTITSRWTANSVDR